MESLEVFMPAPEVDGELDMESTGRYVPIREVPSF